MTQVEEQGLTIPEDVFWESYKPIEGPDQNTVWEHKDTLTYPLHQVWSLVDGESDDGIYALPGYHIVNVFGYCITQTPWNEDIVEAVWFEPQTDAQLWTEYLVDGKLSLEMYKEMGLGPKSDSEGEESDH